MRLLGMAVSDKRYRQNVQVVEAMLCLTPATMVTHGRAWNSWAMRLTNAHKDTPLKNLTTETYFCRGILLVSMSMRHEYLILDPFQ